MHNLFLRILILVKWLFGVVDKHSEYGWLPDLPDARDHIFESGLKALPPLVDLRDQNPPIYDQGRLGSCTANATGALFQFVLRKMGGKDFFPSRLFLYYGARLLGGNVATDSGSYIRNAMKVLNKQGVCAEPTWPYVVTDFRLKPSSAAYTEAKLHQSIAYKRLPRDLTSMKQCLAEGYPFALGFTVYDSFHSAEVSRTGIMPMPGKDEQPRGGHAVLAVGYDDTKQCFIVRNSWGTWWGDKGYFYMPYAMLTTPGYSADFWTLRKVELT